MPRRKGLALPALALAVALGPGPSSLCAQEITRLELLGQALLPSEGPSEGPCERVAGPRVGGLSALTYDPESDALYALSDDGGEHGPPRIYRLHLDLSDGRLDAGDVRVSGLIEIRRQDGSPFPPRTLDPEGLALAADGGFYLSSEGAIRRGVPPSLHRLSAEGLATATLALPAAFLPTADGSAGARHNQALESLTLSPDGAFLFTANEGTLIQDGPVADLEHGGRSRILRYRLPAQAVDRTYAYPTDPVAAAATVPDGLELNGLVELLALSPRELLALERSYSQGAGNSIRLFRIQLPEEEPSEPDTPLLAKELVVDLADLGLPLDNLEGLAFGPRLPDGRSSLLLVSDDNFNPTVQVTQLIAFALSRDPLSVHDLQGPGHRSPYAGQWVAGVEGVVTEVDDDGRERGFWLQETRPDDDLRTSEGIFVATGASPPGVRVGDRVTVRGRVEELERPGALSLTHLVASPPTQVRLITPSSPQAETLPAPVILGREGRRPPAEVIDDDRLQSFQPESDGIDFFESLEGMRVQVREPLTVGPTASFGGFTVVGDGGRDAGPRTPFGGVRLTPGDANPERIQVSPRLLAEPPQVNVGDTFAAPLVGVLHYDFGSYELVASSLPALAPRAAPAEPMPTGQHDEDELTVATYNVRNLSAVSDPRRFSHLATQIVERLASPDVIALEEIQDDNGPEDDGTVSAAATWRRLTDAIRAAGGPAYEVFQIDPEDGRDGGQPGANIRVGFLLRHDRVEGVRRGEAGPRDATAVEAGDDGPRLSLSPGRLAPSEPCFTGPPEGEGSRKPLALEVRFRGRRLFLSANHLSSKRGDDRLFGARQPPVPLSEDRRNLQARVVRGFVEELLALDPGAGIVVLGDLNEHEFRPSLAILTGGGLVNLTAGVPDEERYSFIFQGSSQLLDHILVSPALAAGAQAEVIHLNAHRAASRAASDHDPVLARLRIP